MKVFSINDVLFHCIFMIIAGILSHYILGVPYEGVRTVALGLCFGGILFYSLGGKKVNDND